MNVPRTRADRVESIRRTLARVQRVEGHGGVQIEVPTDLAVNHRHNDGEMLRRQFAHELRTALGRTRFQPRLVAGRDVTSKKIVGARRVVSNSELQAIQGRMKNQRKLAGGRVKMRPGDRSLFVETDAEVQELCAYLEQWALTEMGNRHTCVASYRPDLPSHPGACRTAYGQLQANLNQGYNGFQLPPRLAQQLFFEGSPELDFEQIDWDVILGDGEFNYRGPVLMIPVQDGRVDSGTPRILRASMIGTDSKVFQEWEPDYRDDDQTIVTYAFKFMLADQRLHEISVEGGTIGPSKIRGGASTENVGLFKIA